MTETALEAKVRTLVRDEGRITFARFMEMALYDPEYGYYMQPGRVGESGDFFTSPSIHPAFGALICVQLRQMWEQAGSPDEFVVVEMGAGNGLLSEDIRRYAVELDDGFADAMTVAAVDRDSQATPRGVTGCVVSNELLDAMSVHRFTIVDGDVRELWVSERDGELVEVVGEVSDARVAERVSGLRLADGYVGEVCLELDRWASEVGRIVERGFVMTVDYGYPRELLYADDRAKGTLRCYYRHTLNMSPFQHIGEQDLSVHVDFTAVDEALAGQGFDAVGKTSQAMFLERLGIGQARGGAADMLALRELVKPDGLGGFVVAAHAKGVAEAELAGLVSGEVPVVPPLPVLDNVPRRVRLRGGYPQGTEFEATWEELLGGEAPPKE